MTRQPVTSKAIKSIGHDGTDLEVEMASGAIYRYHDVPAKVHAGLVVADSDPDQSLGKQFHRSVRMGSYKFTKVEPEEIPVDTKSTK